MRSTVSADVALGSWRCGYPETDIGDRLLVADIDRRRHRASVRGVPALRPPRVKPLARPRRRLRRRGALPAPGAPGYRQPLATRRDRLVANFPA